MNKFIIGLAIVALLPGCDTKEKQALQGKVDSLNVELDARKGLESNMEEIGTLIDSIDASRRSLQLRMVEGKSYSDYVARLKAINAYVQETEAKLASLEKSSSNSSKASKSAIRRLKADLTERTEEVLGLQTQIAKAREENLVLWTKVNQKDSLIALRDQVIKLNEGDIKSLEKLVNDSQAENKLQVANLYYEQAQALEMAANRTQFAPRKKREAREEALELYKLSNSLGKPEAQKKIDELEKTLS